MFESTFFLDFLILIGSATLFATISYYLRVPTSVGYFLAGTLIGPFGLKLVSSLPKTEILSEVGTILLMFYIGLEFSIRKLAKYKDYILKLGLFQVVLTISATLIVSYYYFNLSLPKSLFAGFLVSLSSTALVMKLLSDANELDTPYALSSIGPLLLQDLAVIPMMATLPILASSGNLSISFSIAPFSLWVMQIACIILFTWFASRFAMPYLLEGVVKTQSKELFFFFILFLCFGTAYVFYTLGLSISLGAFAVGILISESPFAKLVTTEIRPFKDMFIGIFFVAIGMLLNLNFVFSHFPQILGIGLFSMLIKIITFYVACRLSKVTRSISLVTALITCQIGEFSFILAARGLDLGLLSKGEYQYFLSASILSMLLTPFLFKLAPYLAFKKRLFPAIGKSQGSQRAEPMVSPTTHPGEMDKKGHAIIIGYGIAGQNLAASMASLGVPFKVIEMNYQTVKQSKDSGVDILFGDATQPEILRHANIDKAQIVIITISSSRILPFLVDVIRNLRPDVHIIIRAHYLSELTDLGRSPSIEVVVSEIDTTIDILSRTLRVYDLKFMEIQDYIIRVHNRITSSTQVTPSLRTPIIGHPRSCDQLILIEVIVIKASYVSIGTSVGDLDLYTRSGASIAYVYRSDFGITVPDAHFHLKAHDLIAIYGNKESLDRARLFLQTGDSP